LFLLKDSKPSCYTSLYLNVSTTLFYQRKEINNLVD